MGCLQSWVLAFIPYGDQFFLQQEHHVVLVFLRGWTEKDPTNMCSHGEIHFVLMFCFLLFDDGTVDQHFRHVVCNKVCPYFLFDILWLIRMVIAQADRIFQFAEGGFNRLSPVVEDLDPFWCEFFPWEICHDTFVGTIADGEPDDTESKRICVRGAIFDKIKGGCQVNETSVGSLRDKDFSGVTSRQSDSHVNIKGFRFREFEISDQAFGMNVLCAEEEILSLFHYMCHVVVGAVAPVANVDILPSGERPMPVHDVAECAKFVFFMHGLEDGVRIDVCIKVKKGIYMYAVDTAGRMPRRAEILRWSQLRAAEKRGCGAVGGQVAVSVVCSGEARQPADGIVEARKDGFQRFGLEFCTLLV